MRALLSGTPLDQFPVSLQFREGAVPTQEFWAEAEETDSAASARAYHRVVMGLFLFSFMFFGVLLGPALRIFFRLAVAAFTALRRLALPMDVAADFLSFLSIVRIGLQLLRRADFFCRTCC